MFRVGVSTHQKKPAVVRLLCLFLFQHTSLARVSTRQQVSVNYSVVSHLPLLSSLTHTPILFISPVQRSQNKTTIRMQYNAVLVDENENEIYSPLCFNTPHLISLNRCAWKNNNLKIREKPFRIFFFEFFFSVLTINAHLLSLKCKSNHFNWQCFCCLLALFWRSIVLCVRTKRVALVVFDIFRF